MVLLHEGRDDAVGRRAVGRIGERLAVGILQRLDRRIRLHIPVEVIGAGRLGADHAHRRALRIGAEHAHHAGGDADIDAARNHRLLGLARAIGVDDLQLQAVFLEDAGELADFGHRGVPVAALADRQFHLVLRAGGGHSEQCQRRKCGRERGRERLVFSSVSSLSFFAAISRLVRCLAMRSSGASLPPPRLRQFVVFGTTPSYELMVACADVGLGGADRRAAFCP